jgi:hypothetical protein
LARSVAATNRNTAWAPVSSRVRIELVDQDQVISQQGVEDLPTLLSTKPR